MLEFILTWMAVLVGTYIYLLVKKCDFGIRNDIIALVLSFIMVSILNIIQLIFSIFINLIL